MQNRVSTLGKLAKVSDVVHAMILIVYNNVLKINVVPVK
jgi:hypothetical protein